MIRILATVIAAGAVLGASQTFAADDPPATPLPPPASAMPQHPTSHTDPNAVICKREQSTESRLGGAKICHTRQEWADMSAAARASVNDMQMKANMGVPPH